MLNKVQWQFCLTTAFIFTLINSVDIALTNSQTQFSLNLYHQALARSSGGRSGGGSFKKRSSGSSNSSQNSSSGSTSRSKSNITSPPPRYRPRSSSGGNVIIVPSGGGGSSGGGVTISNPILLRLMVLGLFGLIAFMVFSSVASNLANRPHATRVSAVEKIRDNDIVTVSRLQVALLAQAQDIQAALTQLSLSVNTSTDSGLVELLRESALILLRHSEYWSHALANSQSLHISGAEEAFNRFSVAELSKFSSETLTNMDGKVKQKEVSAPEGEIGSYIVVTLLTGTADDKPLFDTIHSVEELKSALETLAALRSDYLMRFELLWSPQTADDSLTYDELLSEYTDMVQLS